MHKRILWVVPNPDGSNRWSVYDPTGKAYVPGAINVSCMQAETIAEQLANEDRKQPEQVAAPVVQDTQSATEASKTNEQPISKSGKRPAVESDEL